MAQKLEAIKGGGGSIKLGTTGTISSLMTRELDSIKQAPAQRTSGSFRHKSQTNIPVSVACTGSSATPKRLQQLRKSMDGASTSGSSSRSPQIGQKTKGHPKYSHKVPMLGSDNIALDRTPSRQMKNEKKVVSNIVEVVDIKCGSNQDRAWASPITNRLKKLGFSKLSESIM